MRSDEWTFSFIAPWGEEISYRYKRNFFDKGGMSSRNPSSPNQLYCFWNATNFFMILGKLYEARKGGEEVQMCMLESEDLF
jgi:hypothetical protein